MTKLTALLLTLLTLWLVGLLTFVHEVGTMREPATDAALPPTEGIVVLTGGSERLAAGLELLAAGKGQKLLISGVYPGLTLERVLAGHTIAENLRACCITLGHEAADTLGNAEETRAWMKAEGFHTLRLVTAHYHMPRSLLIFRQFMPDIAITQYPVTPDSVKLDSWWQRFGTASLLITEYNKYLFASLREALEDL